MRSSRLSSATGAVASSVWVSLAAVLAAFLLAIWITYESSLRPRLWACNAVAPPLCPLGGGCAFVGGRLGYSLGARLVPGVGLALNFLQLLRVLDYALQHQV